jgi:SsrA-binding protein
MVTRKPGGVKRTAGPSRASYDSQEPVIRYVARNRRARHDYDILEVYECGIALKGAEVKSLRLGQASLQDAYARIDDGELWLLGAHLAPYEYASGYGRFDPIRPRKLLLHRQQIDELAGRVAQKALTLVPLSLYFKDGLAKVELALARGRRLYDKRHAIAERDATREAQRVIREHERHRWGAGRRLPASVAFACRYRRPRRERPPMMPFPRRVTRNANTAALHMKSRTSQTSPPPVNAHKMTPSASTMTV